jgi:hypothetical protein
MGATDRVKEIAARHKVSERTAWSWLKKGAPLDQGENAMKEWRSKQKSRSFVSKYCPSVNAGVKIR